MREEAGTTEGHTVKERLAEIKIYDLPDRLDAVLDKLNVARESAPPEYRHAIRLEWECYGDYDDSVEIFYERPVTDEETSVREESERQARARRDAAERAEYHRLKRKYEPS